MFGKNMTREIKPKMKGVEDGPYPSFIGSPHDATQLSQTGHSVRRAALIEEPSSVEIDKAGVCGAAFNCPGIFCLEFKISAYYNGTNSNNRPLK